MSALLKIVLLFSSCFLLSGCFLAPGIDAFKKLGVTPADRRQIFNQEAKEFNEYRYWGKPRDALLRVVPEQRERFHSEFRSESRSMRIVESEIEDVQFDEEAYTAEAEIRVKYYRIPAYMVEERREIQSWRYSSTDGWLLEDRRLEKMTGERSANLERFDLPAVQSGTF